MNSDARTSEQVLRRRDLAWILVPLGLAVFAYPVVWDRVLGQPNFYWIHWVWVAVTTLWLLSVLAWKPGDSRAE